MSEENNYTFWDFIVEVRSFEYLNTNINTNIPLQNRLIIAVTKLIFSKHLIVE